MVLNFFRKGKHRRISVSKIRKKADTLKGFDKLVDVRLSAEANVVLQNLFAQYPPDDGEIGEKLFAESTGDADKTHKKGANIFSGTSFGKKEIAKKVELFKSRIENEPNLKKVSWSCDFYTYLL